MTDFSPEGSTTVGRSCSPPTPCRWKHDCPATESALVAGALQRTCVGGSTTVQLQTARLSLLQMPQHRNWAFLEERHTRYLDHGSIADQSCSHRRGVGGELFAARAFSFSWTVVASTDTGSVESKTGTQRDSRF